MEDKKMKLTKAQLVEKINSERITFKHALEARQKETDIAIRQIQKAMNMVLGAACRKYGTKQGDEFILEIPKPEGLWSTQAEANDKGYRIHAKEIHVD